jgi:enediyne biosynthesis protein E4
LAQSSMAAGVVSTDVDRDGNKDIVLSGNCYPMRVQVGPLDAGIGLMLKGDGKGSFDPVPYATSGLLITGDVRSMISLNTNSGDLLVAAKNNGSVQVISINDTTAR